MHETGHSGLVHWDDPERWDGEEGGSVWGTHVHPWLIHVNVWQNYYSIVIQFSSVAQLCPTLSDPMNCRPPGSSIHGIFQARVLEWGAIPALNTLPHASNLDW